MIFHVPPGPNSAPETQLLGYMGILWSSLKSTSMYLVLRAFSGEYAKLELAAKPSSLCTNQGSCEAMCVTSGWEPTHQRTEAPNSLLYKTGAPTSWHHISIP